MIKGSVLQKDITILHEYAAPNIRTSRHMKQMTELKEEIHNYIWQLQYSLSLTDKTSRLKTTHQLPGTFIEHST